MVVEVAYLCVNADSDFPEDPVLYCEMCFWVTFQPLKIKISARSSNCALLKLHFSPDILKKKKKKSVKVSHITSVPVHFFFP